MTHLLYFSEGEADQQHGTRCFPIPLGEPKRKKNIQQNTQVITQPGGSSKVDPSSYDPFKPNMNTLRSKTKSASVRDTAKVMSSPQWKLGATITATIEKVGPRQSGLAVLSDKRTLVIPNAPHPGMSVTARITRVKSRYVFAMLSSSQTSTNATSPISLGTTPIGRDAAFQDGNIVTLSLPHESKRYGNLVVYPLAGHAKVLCVAAIPTKLDSNKVGKGTPLSGRVQLKVLKVGTHFVFAKVVGSRPLERDLRSLRVRENLRQMLQSGMHLGEKAVNCNARMRKYIWFRQVQGQKTKRPFVQKGRNVLNLFRTRRCLRKTLQVVGKFALKKHPFLFVGTKKSAAALVARAAFLSKGSFFVNTRWLGGMLTNWQTIVKSIVRLKPLLNAKQRMVIKLLEKRQQMKQEMVTKALRTTRKPQIRAFLNQLNTLTAQWSAASQGGAAGGAAQDIGLAYANRRQQLSKQAAQWLQLRDAWTEKRQLAEQLYALLVAVRQEVLSDYAQRFKQLQSQIQQFRFLSALLRLKASTTALASDPAAATPPKALAQSLNRFYASLPNAAGQASTDPNGIGNAFDLLATVDGPTLVAALDKQIEQFERDWAELVVENLQLRMDQNALEKTMTAIRNEQKQLTQGLRLLESKQAALVRGLAWCTTLSDELTTSKRLVAFLQKIRASLTPDTQFGRVIQMAMKHIVDPTLRSRLARYDIYGALENETKKMAAGRKKELLRLEKYFGGMANMVRLRHWKQSLVAVIIDQQREMNAVLECKKLGIPTVQLVDTDANPTLADYVIPTNDDSSNAIRFVLTNMVQRMRLAQTLRSRLKKGGSSSSAGTPSRSAQSSSQAGKRKFTEGAKRPAASKK